MAIRNEIQARRFKQVFPPKRRQPESPVTKTPIFEKPQKQPLDSASQAKLDRMSQRVGAMAQAERDQLLDQLNAVRDHKPGANTKLKALLN